METWTSKYCSILFITSKEVYMLYVLYKYCYSISIDLCKNCR